LRQTLSARPDSGSGFWTVGTLLNAPAELSADGTVPRDGAMDGLVRTDAGGAFVFWRGQPAQAIHDFVLDKLQPHAASFITSASQMTNARKGNLAEFLCAWIGREGDFAPLRPFQPANAHQPLNAISRSGLDLLWSDLQRREFHEALLAAGTFEDLPGKWQAAILKAEASRPKLRIVGSD
jgi:hypothetical protein